MSTQTNEPVNKLTGDMFDLRSALARAIALIDTTIAAGGKEVENPNQRRPGGTITAMPIREWAGVSRQLLPTDWPKVGGRNFIPTQTSIFETPTFRDVWRPGEAREIYAGACEGLQRLGKRLKLPIYKVSTTSGGGVWTRARQLRIDHYGAVWHDGVQYVVDASGGWDSWFPSQLYPRMRPSAGSPVAVAERGILVRLPDTLDPLDFDRSFDAETHKAALNAWVMTEAGRNHCAHINVEPRSYQRFTNYPGATLGKMSPAEEICCFSNRSGADRLIAIAEAVILRHLGLAPTPEVMTPAASRDEPTPDRAA